MPLVPVTLPTGSAPGRHGHDGAARLINCMAEYAGRGGKTPFPIWPVPGLKSFAASVGNGPCRGLQPLGATLYDVTGRQVIPVDTSGTAGTSLGGFAGDGPVYMDRNQNATPQVILVSDGNHEYIQGGALAPITDSDLPPSNSVVTVDGYGVFGQDKGTFYISALNDFTDIDPLDFATAEASPDGLVRPFKRGRELMLMGEKTIEPYTNTGAAAFPFERLSVQPMEFGLLARASAAILEENMVWLAHDGTVRMASGYESVRISNHAVERSIAAETAPEDIEAFTYYDRGHSFYVLSGTGFTWVFDFTLAKKVTAEEAWHERVSQSENRWRASKHADFDGKNITGDFENGNLYQIDSDTYDEAGNDLIMTIQFPIVQYPNRLRVNWIYVDAIPGVGLNSSDSHVSDPKIMLRLSNDGGITFGNEKTLDLGQIGERWRRIPFRVSRIFGEDGAVARLSVSAAVVRGITGIHVDVDVLEA